VGQDVEAIGCSSLSATVSADEQSQSKGLILLKDNPEIEKGSY